MSDDEPGVIPMLSYRDGPTAMDWLSRVFAFETRKQWLDDDGVLSHGEMSTGNGVIMLATPSKDYEGPALHRGHCESAAAWSAVPWVVDGVLVYVDDIATHFDQASREGAPPCPASRRVPVEAASTAVRTSRDTGGCSCSESLTPVFTSPRW